MLLDLAFPDICYTGSYDVISSLLEDSKHRVLLHDIPHAQLAQCGSQQIFILGESLNFSHHYPSPWKDEPVSTS